MTKFKSNSVNDTENFGKKFAEKLTGGEIIAIYGDLGMGKTALVRGICNGLSITDEVSSPTFSIVHEYLNGDIPVFHFDMYRITSWDDLESTAFFEYMNRGGIVITEWSENIEEALPENTIKVTISRDDENERTIIVD